MFLLLRSRRNSVATVSYLVTRDNRAEASVSQSLALLSTLILPSNESTAERVGSKINESVSIEPDSGQVCDTVSSDRPSEGNLTN